MEFLPLKKFGYANGQSRLITKCAESLEDTVMATLGEEK